LYLTLGKDDAEIELNYQGLVESGLTEEQLVLIRRTVNKGIILGNERFSSKVALFTGQRLATGQCGKSRGQSC